MAFVHSPLSVKAAVEDDEWQGRKATAQWTVPSAVFSSPNTDEVTVTFAAPGTYVAELTVFDGEFTVTDSINITVQPRPFDMWRQTHFSVEELLDSQVSGTWSDPDRDVIPNFHEYFFGRDPGRSDSASPLTIELHEGKLRVSWTQLAVVPDAVVTPQMAFRIDDVWFDAPELFEVNETPLPGGQLKIVTVTVGEDATAAKSTFVRIAISQP